MLQDPILVSAHHPWLALLTSISVYHSIRVFCRLYVHPLAKFPGPKLAAVTRWSVFTSLLNCTKHADTESHEYYFEIFCGGLFARQIEKMHEEYGPIVRINSFELHINDPEFYFDLYNFDPKLEKRDFAVENLQHTASSSLHRIRRRAFEPYFSKNAIQSIEWMIQEKINVLCSRIEEAKADGRPIKLSLLYRCLTADIISEYALGQSYCQLDDPKKSEVFLEAFAATFQGLWFLREVPYLSYLVRYLSWCPAWMISGNSVVAIVLRWQAASSPSMLPFFVPKTGFCSPAIAYKLKTLRAPTIDPYIATPIFSSYIRNSTLPPSEKTPQRLQNDALMILAAGFETTAFTLTTATYHLLANPSTYQKLKSELLSLSSSLAPPRNKKKNHYLDKWTCAALENLPFLSAVVKESLRLSLGATTRLARINKSEAIVYGKWIIPKGTAVSMSQPDILMNAAIFPSPREFLPERWMIVGDELKHLEKYLVTFSRGRRRCLGVHLAHAELYMTIAALVARFDEMHLFETARADVEPARDYFVPAPEPGGNGLRVMIS